MNGRISLRPPATVLILLLALGASGCVGHRPFSGATPTPSAVSLDTVFRSPTGRYTLRVNRAWQGQELQSQGGIQDYFTLPDGAFSVVSDNVIPGTQLDHFTQTALDSYRQVHVQGIERMGSIDVGGGKGELVKARTYVNGNGETVFSPPSPGATPRTLYQAFYVAGNVGFTFSIVWPQSGHTDYLALFRSILHTFTLAGTA